MGIALLKKLNTKMPDGLKTALGPLIRGKLIYNSTFRHQYSALVKADTYSYEEQGNNQLAALKETLVHAYEHTAFYCSAFDKAGFNPHKFSSFEEMKHIPVITKADVIANYDAMQADDINDFYHATTGGSTGVPLKVSLERESIYRERAFIYHYWSKAGYDYRTSKLATFRGTDFNGKLFKANPLYNEIQFNPCRINAGTIQLYYDKIMSFGADFLHGFPGAIYSFCKFANRVGLEIKDKFKGAFFISENVYDFQREYIEQSLGCKTYAFYGHTERAVFAEFNGGGYSFNKAYGYVELSEQSEGFIICTGFINHKMPLIRYQVDDYAERYFDRYKIEGHREGGLIGKNGENISSAMLEVHSPVLERMAKYQFIQKEQGKVTVLTVPVDKFTEQEVEEIRMVYQNKFGEGIDVEVKPAKDVQYTSRGKYKLIVRE